MVLNRSWSTKMINTSQGTLFQVTLDLIPYLQFISRSSKNYADVQHGSVGSQCSLPMLSHQWRVLLGLRPNTPLVFCRILDKKVITICLSRVSRVWQIKQVLNSNKNLLDSNSWSPTAVLVKN